MAPDDDAVGQRADRFGLPGVGNAKTHGYRHFGELADFTDFTSNIFDLRLSGAGHTGDGYIVEKPVASRRIVFRRSLPVVGATSEIKSSPAASVWIRNSPASSGGKSTTSKPSTPTSFAALATLPRRRRKSD